MNNLRQDNHIKAKRNDICIFREHVLLVEIVFLGVCCCNTRVGHKRLTRDEYWQVMKQLAVTISLKDDLYM